MFHTEANVTIHSDSKFCSNIDRVCIFPIPVGPYQGVDYLHMEATRENRFMHQRVRRIAKDGTVLKDYGEFQTFEEACAEVKRLIFEQCEADAEAVFCKLRWSV